MEKREPFEDLHHCGKCVEAEEDIKIYRVSSSDALAARKDKGQGHLEQPTVLHLAKLLVPSYVC